MKRVWIVVGAVLALAVMGALLYLFLFGMSGLHLSEKPADGQTRVACVGDSITYGHGVAVWPKNQYPKVLGRFLGEGFCVNNYGVSGTTAQDTGDSPYRHTAIYLKSLNFDADILVFMLGTNDSKPYNWTDANAFKTQYLSLLDDYALSEPSKVFLCTPARAFWTDGSTSGPTAFDIQPLVVDEIAQAVREIAAERGYRLIDVYELTSVHPEWFEADGVHPDKEGAAAMAQLIAEAIR